MRPDRGTTLVELMVALTVLAVGIVGFTSAFVGSATLDRANTGRALAETLAAEAVGAINSWQWTDPRLAPDTAWTTSSAPYFGKGSVTNFTDTYGLAPNVNTFSTTASASTETLAGGVGLSGSGYDYGNASFDAPPAGVPAWGGRSLAADVNNDFPGDGFVLDRVFDVQSEPTNANLKWIAVHVTYERSTGNRSVVDAYSASYNVQALIQGLGGVL